MNRRGLRAILLALLLAGCLVPVAILDLPAADNDSSLPSPPLARTIPKVTEINGQKMVDNYYWLRDKQNPDVRAYLEAENAYTNAVMRPTEALQKKLYDEMLGRIKETTNWRMGRSSCRSARLR